MGGPTPAKIVAAEELQDGVESMKLELDADGPPPPPAAAVVVVVVARLAFVVLVVVDDAAGDHCRVGVELEVPVVGEVDERGRARDYRRCGN